MASIKIKTLIFSISLIVSCGSGKNISKSSLDPEKAVLLKSLYNEKLHEARLMSEDGWIAPDSCDGMLWSAKLATATCSLSLENAEPEPGRFQRRPFNPCWDNEDRGAISTWSRDMGTGLIAYSISCGRLDVLERHASYGKSHKWIMGHPAISQVLYTPNMISTLQASMNHLGGKGGTYAKIPLFLPKGLFDYQAHIQAMLIWIRMETSGKISDDMGARISDHYKREPFNPFYAYLKGLNNGNMNEPASLLLDPEMPMSDYVRCEQVERCRLAEWIFSARLVLKSAGEL